MKEKFNEFKKYWLGQSTVFKGLTIAFVVLLIVLIWSNWNTYKGKSNQLKEKEIENLILKTRLEEQKEITDGYRTVVDSLTKDWQNFNIDTLENNIKSKYDEKRNAIISQPIDSTISALSDWLNEK